MKSLIHRDDAATGLTARVLVIRSALILFAWASLAGVNHWLGHAGFVGDRPDFFPISIFIGPALNHAGLIFGPIFALLVIGALRFHDRCGPSVILLLGLMLILLGNLMQGGLDAAFYRPIYGAYLGLSTQYYHDAALISDWRGWLEHFNEIQPLLNIHARTHPPFAVLLHYSLAGCGPNPFETIAYPFIFLSAISVVLLRQMPRACGCDVPTSNKLALLYACLPAANIYSAVSLDAVITTFCCLFFLGMALIETRGFSPRALLYCITGFTGANLLSFGGRFLAAFVLVFGIWTLWKNKRPGLLLALGICSIFFILLCTALRLGTDYDHLRAFLTASRLENPHGFYALAQPASYIWTRIENLCELALFLGLPILVLLPNIRRATATTRLQDFARAAPVCGILVLASMFLAGAYRSGETARACLFLYPLLLLPCAALNQRLLTALFIATAAQTAVMQTFGDYFW